MRVKLTTLMSGPSGTHQPGAEIDVSDEQGRDLVAGNYAFEIAPHRTETATARPGETAEQTTAKAPRKSSAGVSKKTKARK